MSGEGGRGKRTTVFSRVTRTERERYAAVGERGEGREGSRTEIVQRWPRKRPDQRAEGDR